MHESGENYLETILLLKRRNGTVRSVDIAAELGYSKASISRAMALLRESGHITMDRGGDIELTSLGEDTARSIYDRHCNISKYLEHSLGLDPETAEKDACRIEHIISEETFGCIREYVAKAEGPVSD